MCECWGIYRLWTHQKGVTGVCDGGAHTKNNNEFALKWVVRGDQELPSVITRGVIWHYSRVYDVDYAEAGKAAGF